MSTSETVPREDNEVTLLEIPLDRLSPPEHDVREDRDPDQIRDLAMSLDQNGQLQPAKTFVDVDGTDQDVEDPDSRELEDLIKHVGQVQIVDGMSRYRAAEQLEWPTLRCEVWRYPPAEAVLESLAANTDRLTMSDYETLTTLKELKERTGMDLQDLAERVEYHPSTLSQYLGALDGFEPAVEAWRDPSTHVGLGHVLELKKADTPEVQEKVFADLMSNEKSVGMTRETVKSTNKYESDQRQDPRTIDERQRDGETRRAEREVEKAEQAGAGLADCDLCGSTANTKVAVDTCPDCRGIVIRQRETGEPLFHAMADVEDSGVLDDVPTAESD